ncbi:class I SAM-dependent methyltransferase [Haliangium sp.]|uniref:class I SAM-dependent methyltransferase n=1 Tax=Haliangium sp. TaxID=2663208 RepID=UPI003D139335
MNEHRDSSSPGGPEPGTDGWTRAFYEHPLAVALLPTADELTERVACVERLLELAPGATVLDQCCGAGAMSLALAVRGHRVVGVDISRAFIARAQAEADSRALDACFTAADACAWRPPPATCDGGFNWGTGFGCFDSDDGNRAMLARASEALRPGARFALDYYNVAGVLAGFRDRFAYERPFEGRQVGIERDSELDLAAGALHQRWRLRDGDQVVEFPRTTTRLYLPHALAALLASVGLTVERFEGDYCGGSLALSSPRCVAVARKQ